MCVEVKSVEAGEPGEPGHRWSNAEHLDLRLERNLGWNRGSQAGDVHGQPVSGLDTSGGWREMAGWINPWSPCISCMLQVCSYLQVQVGQVHICSSVYET